MRSNFVIVFVSASLFIGTIEAVSAQEIPETFLKIGHRAQGPWVAQDYINQIDGEIYINHPSSCTMLVDKIEPCG